MTFNFSIKDFFKRLIIKWFSPKSIRLAVVGTASSGKSFLLRDIIDALRCLGCVYFVPDPDAIDSYVSREGFQYKAFSDYNPNQKDGNGQTPLYACRGKDHYWQLVKGPNFKFDLSFLNIPGEIFTDTLLQNYNELKRLLRTRRKLFTVHTYVNVTGAKRLIVKPNAKFCTIENDGIDTDSKEPEKDAYKLSFEPWSEINRKLKKGNFEQDSKKNISGKKLMLNFFKYDTDSVMRSICELIKNKDKIFPNLKMDHVSFEEEKNDIAFVFFHYCTLATDIVLCDRVYTHLKEKTEQNKERKPDEQISFKDLIKNLSQFLDLEELASRINVYLAFRNVDFLLQDSKVEGAYVDLNRSLKAKHRSHEYIRNVIYSLFSYLMFDQIGYDMNDIGDSLEYILGLEEGDRDLLKGCSNNANGTVKTQEDTEQQDKKKEDIERAFIDELKDRYLDLQGSKAFIFDADSLEDHLKSRIGGDGQAFRMLLAQTGWYPEINDTFIPHVFFTCTPITEDYLVYRNGRKGEDPDEFDFYHEGLDRSFSEANSHAYFGSYQLCMDIFNNHDMGSFNFGALLQRICNIV